MDAESWQKVLESIRPEDQKSVIVRTVDAMEVAVESLARIEKDVLIVKGRLSGAPDGRRVFLFPYDKLSCLYVNRAVANDEIALYSPTISREEKDRIAREVAERQRNEDDDAKKACHKEADPQVDVRSQLDELKRTANFPASTPAGSASPPGREKPANPSPQPAEKQPLIVPPPEERKPGTKYALPAFPKMGNRG